MTRDEAVSRIQVKLGFRTDKAADIVNYLQDEQIKLEKRPVLPHWLVSEVSDITTTINEERVHVPADFLREYEDPDGGDQLWYFNPSAADTDKWTVVVKSDMETLREAYPGSGPPKLYALTEDYFRIGPTPDDTYTLKMIYYKKDALLTTNIENAWLANMPDLLIGRAGMQMAEAFRDTQAWSYFNNMATGADDIVDRDEEARAHANRRYIMGGVD